MENDLDWNRIQDAALVAWARVSGFSFKKFERAKEVSGPTPARGTE